MKNAQMNDDLSFSPLEEKNPKREIVRTHIDRHKTKIRYTINHN